MGGKLIILSSAFVLLSIFRPLTAGVCEFAGFPTGSNFRIVDYWISEEGIELCIARSDQFVLLVKTGPMPEREERLPVVSELLRDYLDVKLSEVEGLEQKKEWNKKRALLVGSLIDFKHRRVGLEVYQQQADGWRRLESARAERLQVGVENLELYFKRLPESSNLLGDLCGF